MKDEIKRKLAASVEGPLSEAQVTYILIKVRELLDIKRGCLADSDPAVTEINLLKAYCDWTVHINMTYAGRTKAFISAIDDYVRSEPTAGNTYRKAFEDLYYFDDFRVRLSQFLSSEALPCNVTDNLGRWVEFLKYYGGIVHNRSMEYSGNDLVSINHIAVSTLCPSPAISLFDGAGNIAPLAFGMKVEFRTKDDRRGSLILPDGKLTWS